jgi:hypothetical protein
VTTATKSELKPVMTLTEFESTFEFLACSEKQRRWLQTLLANGFDYTKATELAFDCSNPRNARLFGYAVRRQTHIVAALNLYLGRPEPDAVKVRHQKSVRKLLRGIRFQLRHAEPGSTSAQRLMSQWQTVLLGGRAEVEADEPEPTPAPPPPADTPKATDVPQPPAASTSRVPPGCRPARSKTTGELKGYLTPAGEFVSFAAVEVVR